jgi:hypothetical protein
MTWQWECIESKLHGYRSIHYKLTRRNIDICTVNSTDIYISSYKFVLNRSISMDIRFNIFPLSWCEVFYFNSYYFKEFCLSRTFSHFRWTSPLSPMSWMIQLKIQLHGIQIFELNLLTHSIPFVNWIARVLGMWIFADFRFFSNRGCSWCMVVQVSTIAWYWKESTSPNSRAPSRLVCPYSMHGVCWRHYV